MERSQKQQKSNRRERRAGELEERLGHQISFIRRSAQFFDEGHHEEAINIAGRIRTLVRDTRNSHALLSQLGLLQSMKFLDTGVYRDLMQAYIERSMRQSVPSRLAHDQVVLPVSPSEIGLVELGQGSNGSFGWYPPLRPKPNARTTFGLVSMRPPQPFERWWNDPVTESAHHKSFSRRDLVMILADQDGGAHVDPQIDADFSDLCLDSVGMSYAENRHDLSEEWEELEPPLVLNNVAWGSVRQIAFELLISLELHLNGRNYPGIFAFADPFMQLPMPKITHRPIDRMTPIVIGTVAPSEDTA